jgi:ABC-type polysaccharide/polyol phosphate export permease
LAFPFAGLAMLTIGIALLVSGADVYFRDVPYLYDLAMFLVLLTSPIFYPAEIVPQQILRLLEVNPLFAIMGEARTLILTDGWPPFHALALTLIEGAVVLALGVAGFRAMSPNFMEQL